MKLYPRIKVAKIGNTWFAINTGNRARLPHLRTGPKPRAFDTHAEALAYAFRVRDYWLP